MMVLRVGDNGYLEADGSPPELSFAAAPTARTFNLDGGIPLAHVWHTTDLPAAVTAAALAARIRDYGITGRRSSWHQVIDRDGTIHVSAPYTVGTWHVKGAGKIGGKSVSVNRNTIGTELHNCGKLVLLNGTYFGADGPGNPRYRVSENSVLTLDGAAYEAFPRAQVEAAEALVRALAEKFGWGRDQFNYGHVDFEPNRKQDPWPVWRIVVLPALLDRVFGP